MYTTDQTCNIVDFLADNISVKFGGCLFRQVIGIPIGTNGAPFLADLFVYSLESEFLNSLLRSGHRKFKLAMSLIFVTGIQMT